MKQGQKISNPKRKWGMCAPGANLLTPTWFCPFAPKLNPGPPRRRFAPGAGPSPLRPCLLQPRPGETGIFSITTEVAAQSSFPGGRARKKSRCTFRAAGFNISSSCGGLPTSSPSALGRKQSPLPSIPPNLPPDGAAGPAWAQGKSCPFVFNHLTLATREWALLCARRG